MIFITGNKNKYTETQAILGIDLEMITLNLPEIQSENPVEVAKSKAEFARTLGYDDFIIEDSGLYLGENEDFGALIKWFPIDRIEIAYWAEKAIAVSCFVLCKDGKFEVFSNEVLGTITERKGNNGFGWDSIFRPVGFNKTFAEMTPQEKNEVSPRARALSDLKKYLTK